MSFSLFKKSLRHSLTASIACTATLFCFNAFAEPVAPKVERQKL
jgi:hypothetical protein